MKNYQKYLKIFLILAVILVLAHPHFANAAGVMDWITDIALTPIMKMLSVIAMLFGYVAGVALFLAGNLVNWTLSLNANVLGGSAVQTGWIVARDLANLGFVLAIILIAFATILRIETYEMKKTLTRLIIAALLINFSLVIAGVFVDFSGVLTDFFLAKATGGSLHEVGKNFANAFRVQTFLQVTEDPNAIQEKLKGMTGLFIMPFVASLIFIAIFTVIATIAMLGLAIMLLIRYIALTILLILMPIAWLMWIWPDLEKFWQEWWDNFLKWVWFAPASAFFIYLSLSIVAPPGTASQYALQKESLAATGILMPNLGETIGQMIAVIGILFGGLIASEKTGVGFAKVATATATGFATGSVKWLGGKTGQALTSPLRTGLGRQAVNALSQAGIGGKGVTGWLAKQAAAPLRGIAGAAVLARGAAAKPPDLMNSVVKGTVAGMGVSTRWFEEREKDKEEAKSLRKQRRADQSRAGQVMGHTTIATAATADAERLIKTGDFVGADKKLQEAEDAKFEADRIAKEIKTGGVSQKQSRKAMTETTESIKSARESYKSKMKSMESAADIENSVNTAKTAAVAEETKANLAKSKGDLAGIQQAAKAAKAAANIAEKLASQKGTTKTAIDAAKEATEAAERIAQMQPQASPPTGPTSSTTPVSGINLTPPPTT
ncbi:MAG: hypothetical protein HZB99_04360 [Candidatus Harrisonbacteria bacterium]|nr:hypothetical protein [Candidatus Harrisonbacteria bacterium]